MSEKLVACSLAFIALTGVAAAESTKAEPKTTVVAVKPPPMPPQLDETLFGDPATAQWGPVKSLPAGAQGALIGTSASDGGMAGWLKFPAGYRVPPSWDTHRASYTVVTGTLTVTSNGKKHVMPPGGFVIVTAKDKHELVCGASECLILVQHYGPPDMHWVNPADAPKAR
jgi:hypothetical protein